MIFLEEVTKKNTNLIICLEGLMARLAKESKDLGNLQKLIIYEMFLHSLSSFVLGVCLFLRFTLPYISHPAHKVEHTLVMEFSKVICAATSSGALEGASKETEAFVAKYKKKGALEVVFSPFG